MIAPVEMHPLDALLLRLAKYPRLGWLARHWRLLRVEVLTQLLLLTSTLTFFYQYVAGHILADYDTFVYFYPLRQYAADALREGRLPLWNPLHFFGSPFLANPQTAIFYPPNLLFYLEAVPTAYSHSVILHVYLAAAFTYLFLRSSLALPRWPAVVGAGAFAFGGFVAGQIGHINQLNATSWLPLMVWLLDRAIQGNRPGLAAALGVVLAIQLLAGHAQESYYSLIALGVFALWRAWSAPVAGAPGWRRLAAPLALLGVATAAGFGLAALQLVPTAELSRYGIRGGGLSYGEGQSFSLPPGLLLHNLLPFGTQRPSTEYYGWVGLLPLALAVLAVGAAHGQPVVLGLVLTLLGLFFAFGGYNPLYPLLFEYLPGLKLFRVPARWLFVYSFGVAILAALGMTWLEQGRVRLRARGWPLVRALAVVVVLGASLALLLRYGEPVVAAMIWLPIGVPLYVPTLAVWGGFAAVAVGGLLVLAPRWRPGWSAALVVVALAELWAAATDLPYRQPVPPEVYAEPRDSTLFVQQDHQGYRVLSASTEEYEIKETPDYKIWYGGEWKPEPYSRQREPPLLIEGIGFNRLQRLLIAAKLNEILSPNINLVYQIASPDGYDGGVLPLQRFVRFQETFLPRDQVSLDGVIRRKLDYFPDLRLVSLWNVRYLLGNKLQDPKIDNLTYDRAVTIGLPPGKEQTLHRLPPMAANAYGVLSSYEGVEPLPPGTPVGALIVTDTAGRTHELVLRAGQETGFGPAADRGTNPPNPVRAFRAGDPRVDYLARLRLSEAVQPAALTFRSLLSEGRWNVRAVTMINETAGQAESLVLADQLDRTLFFDIKVYRNREALPRLFLVHRSTVATDDQALARLRDPDFAPGSEVLLNPSPTVRTLRGSPERGEVEITVFQPERVVARTNSAEDGYLVFTDSFYPGWQARVDGEEVRVERADYLFKAVYVPAGRHEVEFVYVPRWFILGVVVTLVTAAAILALLALRLPWPLRVEEAT